MNLPPYGMALLSLVCLVCNANASALVQTEACYVLESPEGRGDLRTNLGLHLITRSDGTGTVEIENVSMIRDEVIAVAARPLQTINLFSHGICGQGRAYRGVNFELELFGFAKDIGQVSMLINGHNVETTVKEAHTTLNSGFCRTQLQL